MFCRFSRLVILGSVVMLLLAGVGAYRLYSNRTTAIVQKNIVCQTDIHRKRIEQFLKDQTNMLQVVAHTHPKAYFLKQTNLSAFFELINRQTQLFADLSVIDEEGNHLAYFGPYDLMGKNYFKTRWFKQAMESEMFISDMFLGFRKEPHFIIAIKKIENGKNWILRATLDGERFRSLVEDLRIGKTGEVYLLNRDGFFQTEPRFSGKLLEKVRLPLVSAFDGIRAFNYIPPSESGDEEIPEKILSQAWLDYPQWLLIVSQDKKEAYQLYGASEKVVLAFMVLSILIVTGGGLLMTKYFIEKMKKQGKTM